MPSSPRSTLDGLAVVIDQHTSAVRAARSPERLPVPIEYAEINECTAEADAGGKLVARLVVDLDRRAERLAVIPRLGHRDRGRTIPGEIEHRLLCPHQRVDALFPHHRVLNAEAQYVGELLGDPDEKHVQPDERVPRKAVPFGEVDILRREHVLRLREVRVLLDARDLAAVRHSLLVA